MTHLIQRFLNRAVRLAAGPMVFGLMAVIFTPMVRATDPLYEVDSSVAYGPTQVPVIDATTFFVNQAVYFEVELAIQTPFETYNTLNYTNYGTIIALPSIQLDRQITNAFGNTQHLMAANFYNPGVVEAGALTIQVTTSNTSSLLAECIVNATNIVNNNGGALATDENGLIQVTGQNVDFSDGILFQNGDGFGSIQAIPYSTTIGTYLAGSGLDTNKDWDPSVALTANSAAPSDVRIGTFNPAIWQMPFGQLPTTAYYEATEQATNYFIYRSVFAYNGAPNVTDNVYINGINGGISGSGAAAVEFVGTYTNPATGVAGPEYLYVRDDYAEGGITNVPINTVSHIPDNFTFQISAQKLISSTPETPNFTPFPAGILTNTYSYANVECLATTVPTNSISQHDTNYLANMVGSIQIIASSNLDMTGAQIFNQNYLSLTVSNQFNGSIGAGIISPYANFNLAATNASVMVTNLLEPTTPAWNGEVEAWSARWFYTFSNSIITFTNTGTNLVASTNTYTITNDYRVFIVGNFASPGSPSAVWNLSLRDTNNVFISDIYNILNGLYLNCTSLTLTTNASNPGSPYGELNLTGLGNLSPVTWANATPNLRYLTNNGVILLPNNGNFGTAAAPYGALINSGEISSLGSQVWAGNFVNTGTFIDSAGSFILNSQTATMTNAILEVTADASITSGSLITSNLELEADRSLTLTITNVLTDTGPTNDSIWIVGDASIGNGLKMTRLPPTASLLGTSIYNYAPTNRTTLNTWAGIDEGAVSQGFTNNAAIGQLILNAEGPAPFTRFNFSGTGTSNAIYVDQLVLNGFTSYIYHGNTNSIPTLSFNTNLVIYYADATDPNVGDVSFLLNGFNTNHLRWVPGYVGHFSSTTLVYPNGSTNTLNSGLVNSPYFDSNANGTPNSSDPMPLFVPSQMNFMSYLTNNPANTMVISWDTVPLATNYVYYSTNMMNWQLLTNPFVTPEPAPGVITNIMVFDPLMSPSRYYQVVVYPDLLYP